MWAYRHAWQNDTMTIDPTIGLVSLVSYGLRKFNIISPTANLSLVRSRKERHIWANHNPSTTRDKLAAEDDQMKSKVEQRTYEDITTVVDIKGRFDVNVELADSSQDRLELIQTELRSLHRWF